MDTRSTVNVGILLGFSKPSGRRAPSGPMPISDARLVSMTASRYEDLSVVTESGTDRFEPLDPALVERHVDELAARLAEPPDTEVR